MSPPMLDLQTKDNNQDVKVVFPSATVMQQPTVKKSNKKYCLIAASVISAAVVITLGAIGSVALYQHMNRPQEYNTETLYNGHHIPEHARVDYVNKITYVNNTQYGEVLAGNNLHDYNRKLLVFKDMTNQVCYIDKLEGTFEEDVALLAQKTRSTPTPIKWVHASNESIDGDILRKFAGDNIANHCKDIPTFWVIDEIDGGDGESGQEMRVDCTNDASNPLCRNKRAARAAAMACHKIVIKFKIKIVIRF
ncbi:hypothetical protein SNE40_000351 [Patella caerulea]|uniref:BRICHOS domain-containing protein n=1 Tax=Patella caerulea TaxID=87958 RepID=A0AAN8KDN6_PATCE